MAVVKDGSLEKMRSYVYFSLKSLLHFNINGGTEKGVYKALKDKRVSDGHFKDPSMFVYRLQTVLASFSYFTHHCL